MKKTLRASLTFGITAILLGFTAIALSAISISCRSKKASETSEYKKAETDFINSVKKELEPKAPENIEDYNVITKTVVRFFVYKNVLTNLVIDYVYAYEIKESKKIKNIKITKEIVDINTLTTGDVFLRTNDINNHSAQPFLVINNNPFGEKYVFLNYLATKENLNAIIDQKIKMAFSLQHYIVVDENLKVVKLTIQQDNNNFNDLNYILEK